MSRYSCCNRDTSLRVSCNFRDIDGSSHCTWRPDSVHFVVAVCQVASGEEFGRSSILESRREDLKMPPLHTGKSLLSPLISLNLTNLPVIKIHNPPPRNSPHNLHNHLPRNRYIPRPPRCSAFTTFNVHHNLAIQQDPRLHKMEPPPRGTYSPNPKIRTLLPHSTLQHASP
jgi:hypothetical protein